MNKVFQAHQNRLQCALGDAYDALLASKGTNLIKELRQLAKAQTDKENSVLIDVAANEITALRARLAELEGQ
jgi:hypothetical protein